VSKQEEKSVSTGWYAATISFETAIHFDEARRGMMHRFCEDLRFFRAGTLQEAFEAARKGARETETFGNRWLTEGKKVLQEMDPSVDLEGLPDSLVHPDLVDTFRYMRFAGTRNVVPLAPSGDDWRGVAYLSVHEWVDAVSMSFNSDEAASGPLYVAVQDLGQQRGGEYIPVTRIVLVGAASRDDAMRQAAVEGFEYTSGASDLEFEKISKIQALPPRASWCDLTEIACVYLEVPAEMIGAMHAPVP
jgi:hypothetical protein